MSGPGQGTRRMKQTCLLSLSNVQPSSQELNSQLHIFKKILKLVAETHVLEDVEKEGPCPKTQQGGAQPILFSYGRNSKPVSKEIRKEAVRHQQDSPSPTPRLLFNLFYFIWY